jgi:hypothetical protein
MARDRSEALTGNQVKAFLDAKGVGSDCNACGQKDSMGISVNDPTGELKGSAPAIRLIRRLHDQPHLGYGEVLQFCSNCGFIRYFRDIEVLDFLEGDGDNE